MFEEAERGTAISRDEYKKRLPALRELLLQVQQELRTSASSPAIVVLAGADSAGRSETANLLNEWMDPRWVETRAWREPSDEERERPAFWRYWRALPPRGRVGLFINAWYGPPMRDRVEGSCGKVAFKSRLDRISTLERALAAGRRDHPEDLSVSRREVSTPTCEGAAKEPIDAMARDRTRAARARAPQPYHRRG